MAMPRDMVLPDRMQFPSSNGANVGGASSGGVGNEIHQQPHWFAVDERDGFISWLRAEFAAANAIIDSLCQHLRIIGEPGEYSYVMECIQHRRCNWNPVLHMAQYFPVMEVIGALQQVAYRKQRNQHSHRYYHDQPKFKRLSSGFNRWQRGGETVKELVSPIIESNDLNANSSANGNLEDVKSNGSDVVKKDDKSSILSENRRDGYSKNTDFPEQHTCGNGEVKNVDLDNHSSSKEKDVHSSQNQDGQRMSITPNTFVAMEIIDGNQVNIVDGLKLYEHLLDGSEVSELVSLVDEWRTAGSKGQTQGQTYFSRRPMKGHGREIIQFGVPVVDAPFEDENAFRNSKERRIEAIPSLLQDTIERLISMQIISIKPDSCVVDIYNEGDYSNPYMFPLWYGKPVSTLFLTECELVFGRAIASDHPGSGDYRGSFKLPLTPGSLLVMQGKCSDFSRHAIPSIRRKRILITFTKTQPKKYTSSDGQRVSLSGANPSSHWVPPPGRSPNHFRHPAPKNYAAGPSNSILPAPPIRPQIGPANGSQPLVATAPTGPPMPFAGTGPVPPVPKAWPTAPPPRHPLNHHLPVQVPVSAPGTGVFLPPPGSGNATSLPQQVSNAAVEDNVAAENNVLRREKENGDGKSDDNSSTVAASAKDESEGQSEKQDCNGSVNVIDKKEEQEASHTVDNMTDKSSC